MLSWIPHSIYIFNYITFQEENSFQTLFSTLSQKTASKTIVRHLSSRVCTE